MRHRSGKFCLVELDRGFSYAVAKFLYNWYAWIPAPASGNTWRVCNAGNLIPWRCRYPHICNSKKLNGQFTCRIFKIRNFRIVGVNIRYENISAYFSICLMRWLLSHRPARERKPHLVQKSSMGSTHKSKCTHTHTQSPQQSNLWQIFVNWLTFYWSAPHQLPTLERFCYPVFASQ